MGIPVSKLDSLSSLQQRPSVAKTRTRSRRRRAQAQRRIFLTTLLISDAVVVAVALMLAWYIRIGSGLMPYSGPANLPGYVEMAFASLLISLVIFALNGLYDYNILLGGPQEYGAIFRACSYSIVAIVFVSFMQRTTTLSRGWLLIAWGLNIALVGGTRFIWRRIFWWLRRAREWLISPTLIVGANEHGKAIARQFMKSIAGIRVVGFLDDFLRVGSPVVDGLRVLGSPTQLNDLAEQNDVEQVIVAPNAVAWETFREIIRGAGQSTGYQLQLSPGFYEILTTSVRVTHKAFVPLLRVTESRITGIDLILKTSLDFALGVFLVLLCSPLQLIISLAILLTNGRPILEKHEVLGIHGSKFHTIKFRTDLNGTTRRMLGGRIPRGLPDGLQFGSRLGRLLYGTGLDKLPQLFDVLRGRMSLVGPRTVSSDLEYEHRPWLPSLLTVRPGWTGPWAIGSPEELEAEMRLALYYIRNWTIWLDLQILFRTAKLLLAHMGRTSL